MKQYSNHLFVEVPGDAKDISIETITTGLMDMTFLCLSRKTQIPNGRYSIVGLAKDLTVEHWDKIVESAKTFGWRKYDAINGEYQWTTNAMKSGLSLIKSLGLEGNVLILKKQLT